MAEKRVSVRLSATGGRQVRAELEGVGVAGSRGMGRLSHELDQANARMAAFARRTRIAATAAATALAAAVVAMTRSTVAAANEISQLSQVANANPEVFQRWSAASATVGIEQEKLADILKDVNDRVGDFLQTSGGPMADFFENIAPRVGVTADQFARLSGPEALQLYVDSLERAGVSQQEMTFYLEAMASDTTRLIPLLQNGGAEMTRLGTRAQALGAVLDADAIAAMRRSELALVSIGQVFTGVRNRIAVALAPSLEAVANAFVALASSTSPISRAFDAVLSNLDRLAIYAGTFATFLAGRWVSAMAAAALSVRGLATTLVVLKGALIRTGIGALIVGAGELVYWFTRLSSGAGSFGEAMGLLKDVAVEVWDRIKMGASSAGAAATAMFYDLKADAASGMAGAIESVAAFGNAAANTFEGALMAVREIWARLPDVIGDLVFSAANRMLDGIEAMLNGAIRRIDAFTGRIRDALAAVGIETTFGQIREISLGDIPNPFAGASADTGTAAADAFRRAFENNPLTIPDLGLETIAAEARATANIYRQAAIDLAGVATVPLTSWGALRDAVAGTGEEGAAALDEATVSANRLSAAMGRAGGAPGSAGDRIATGWRAVSESLQAYAADAMNWGKGLGETLTGAFSGAENAFRSFVETGKFDFKGLVRSILADLAVLSFKRAVLGSIASALGGVFGGSGSVTAAVSHAGGIVGLSGHSRSVPAMAFAGAPRMHNGGTVGPVGSWAGLRPDEVPTILQRGERVLNRREAADYGRGGSADAGMTVNIDARGAQMGVAEQIDARLRAAIPEIARIAKESVADGRRRGQVI
ncbi:phage tail tape measure C-terminal domain-containing protein [Thalassobacter stenotrophicus]|uniref:Phage tail tape measure protein, lambda family n=2 Tax=Thalassobacter stenotrophicus TaxID=266809 RepID=A0A0P1FK71_9RHOB|nr:phage tail tape measure C-terminal domain-containing protein [Thalassobacter stenotrophicus]CUH61553.1 phage tail tape measure protein, lambda family [Thalassobacter stenotrophicus]SHJ07373.1 phage tail tape measure protein, lambda family [Thalassobacter stenotrophicus DSM 16310]